jgi:hypothetical protein
VSANPKEAQENKAKGKPPPTSEESTDQESMVVSNVQRQGPTTSVGGKENYRNYLAWNDEDRKK